MTEKNKNILISILFIILGGFVYIESLNIKHMMHNDVGSAFFPKMVAAVTIVISGVKLAFSLKNGKDETKSKIKGDLAGGWITILLLSVYVLIFAPVGFIISTTVYLFLQMFVLCPKDKRKIPFLGIISVATPLFIYTLFVYVINMPLPKGIFGF
jgi:putative tricarboxylic transport membrane protein